MWYIYILVWRFGWAHRRKSALSTVHVRIIFSYRFLLSFATKDSKKRCVLTRQKKSLLSSKKKRKTQSINCLELTASVPTEHFLKDKISRGVSEPSKAWFGRFLDETTMQRLQRNIIEYIDWKKEKKRNLHAVQSRVLSRDVGEKVLSAYNYICISIRIIKDSSHLVV